MCNTKQKKVLAFVLSLAVLLITCLLFLLQDRNRHVTLLDRPPVLEDRMPWDYRSDLRYRGRTVVADSENTVYIPQLFSGDITAEELFAPLQILRPGCRLYLVPPREAPADAIRQSRGFDLYILGPRNRAMHCRVVFTSLPVLELHTERSHFDEAAWREVYSGEMTLHPAFDPEDPFYEPVFSQVQWHKRGLSSSFLDKKPWKLNLKKGNGKPSNRSLLDLGKDDDWILNPMNSDGTRIRERTFSTLWNSPQVHGQPMSEGRYVEVLTDGQYMGLYMLQRRIDGRYLRLGSRDILFKGGGLWTPETVNQAYELICGSQDGYRLMEPVFTGTDTGIIDLDNYMDVILFLQLTYARDNRGYKNMFYLLRPENGGYRLEYLPWDTDISFGVFWNETFAYDPDTAEMLCPDRPEMASLRREHPDLDRLLARRWFELREDLFSLDNLLAVTRTLQEEAEASGALCRDLERWGRYCGEADTFEAMQLWIPRRLDFLDRYFRSLL